MVRTIRIGGAAVVVAALAGCGGSGAASPAPATSVVTSVVPAPAGTVPPAAPSAAPSLAPATPPAPAPAALPPLPGEGEPGWTTDDDPARAWLLDPCNPTDYPTDADRAAFRTVERAAEESSDTRQVARYPSAAVAAEVLAGFRRALAACVTGGDPARGSAWTWTTRDVPDLGDDGLVAASTVGGPGYSPSGSRVAVAVTGDAVVLVASGGEYGTAELDGGADLVVEVARTAVASL